MNLKMILVFARISLYSFGGFYSIWALTENELVQKCPEREHCLAKGVFTQEDFDRIFGISRMIPGPRTSGITMLGYAEGGVIMMTAILIGLLLPSVFIIPLLTKFFAKISGNENVQALKKGAEIAIIAILLVFLYGIFQKSFTMEWIKTITYCFIAALVFLFNRYYKINPVILIFLATLSGYFFLNS